MFLIDSLFHLPFVHISFLLEFNLTPLQKKTNFIYKQVSVTELNIQILRKDV